MNPKNTPKDVFLHLFNIITFYLSVIGFITLYVKYINVLFPDQLNFYFSSLAEAIRVASAILLISWPVYLGTIWLLERDLRAWPEKKEYKLRKWLLYFTLFIAAITIVASLITFVYNFLSGELTTRFVLKVLVVLVVALAVFGYYLWDLKRKDLKARLPRILAWIVSIVVAGSIVSGFFIIGTPAEQRDRRFDEQRIQHLQTLQDRLINHWTQKKVLPNGLDELTDSISGYTAPRDPQTGASYGYDVKGELSFELCAEFKTDSKDFGPSFTMAQPELRAKTPYYDAYQQNWDHGIGRTCFNRSIDPDLYAPLIKS